MNNKAAVIGITDEKNFARYVLQKKFKFELELMSRFRKGIGKLLSEKFALILIHERISSSDSLGDVKKNQAIIANGIKAIRQGSLNADTPIIVTYNDQSCPSPLNDFNYLKGLDNYTLAGANICISMEDNFNQIFIRAVSSYAGSNQDDE